MSPSYLIWQVTLLVALQSHKGDRTLSSAYGITVSHPLLLPGLKLPVCAYLRGSSTSSQFHTHELQANHPHFPPSHSSCTSAIDTKGGFSPKAQGLTFQKFYQLPWHLQEFKLTFVHLLMTKYVNQENLSGTIQHSLSGSRKGQNVSTHQ